MNYLGKLLLACLFSLATAQDGEIAEIPQCAINQVFTTCVDACRESCSTIGSKAQCSFLVCNRGCDCRDGFVWSTDSVENRTCIRAEECEIPQCAINQVFTTCVDACRDSCSTIGLKPECSFFVCNKGCDCRDGFVWSTGANSTCIRVEECENPQCNRPGKDFSLCAVDQTCQGYFDTGSTRPQSPTNCVPGCSCRRGSVSLRGNCVGPRECCPDGNSQLVRCPNPCPGGTCVLPDFSRCRRRCKPVGCECNPGFLKTSDSNSTCIAEENCP